MMKEACSEKQPLVSSKPVIDRSDILSEDSDESKKERATRATDSLQRNEKPIINDTYQNEEILSPN